jgi:hypothetical protein
MRSRFLHLVLLLVLLCAGTVPLHAEPSAEETAPPVTVPAVDAPYTGVWVDEGATLSDETLKQVVEGVAGQEADPQHIAIMVHGLATPREVSAKQYAVLSKDILDHYGTLGKRAAVVGLQWHSDMGPDKAWIRKVVSATVGGGDDNPYLRKVALARNVGATAGRQLLLALAARFPHARFDVYAHSLGCDVTRNMFAFELQPKMRMIKDAPDPTPTFRPEVPLELGLVALAGADVDYDLLYKTDARLERKGFADLFWVTVGGVRNPDAKDMVLTARGFARGRAMGNSIPKMHRGQIDALCRSRRLVLDANDIPSRHAFLQYYDDKRLARIVDAAVALGDPERHDPLLDTLDEVLKAPADPKTLARFFDKRDLAVTYYALWRLEGILCGGPRHLADGYLERIALMLTDDPEAIDHERWIGPCLVVRDGWWPPQRLVNECIDKLPRH